MTYLEHYSILIIVKRGVTQIVINFEQKTEEAIRYTKNILPKLRVGETLEVRRGNNYLIVKSYGVVFLIEPQHRVIKHPIGYVNEKLRLWKGDIYVEVNKGNRSRQHVNTIERKHFGRTNTNRKTTL